jgi:predicted ArsR family transcriptional regulator
MTLKIETEAVRELPPSAKLVYLVLQEAGPLTQADIVDYTGLPERTARDALDVLLNAGVVDKRPFGGGDARQSTYTLPKREKRAE